MADILNPAFWNDLAEEIHHQENKKWWYDEEGNPSPRPEGTLNMLIVSELAEAMEGHRKSLMDDKLTHRQMIEVELADAVIRRLDKMVGMNELRLMGEINENYNLCETIPEDLYMMVNVIEFTTQTFVEYALSVSKKYGYDLLATINEKREYNKTRADHQRAQRAETNGKKY